MVDYKKVGAAIASVIVVFASGAFVGSLAFPHTVTNTVTHTEFVPVNVTKEVPVVKYVNKTVTVPVDNGNLDVVLKHVYDYGIGDLDLNSLDDNQVNQIVDRIVFLNDARELSRQYVNSRFLSIVDRRDVNNVEINRDDVSRVRVGNIEDFVLNGTDFEYNDTVVSVPVKFEYDSNDFTTNVVVTIRDGSVDESNIA